MTPDGPDDPYYIEVGDDDGDVVVPSEIIFLSDPEPILAPGPMISLVACWRCGKLAGEGESCPRCGASSRPRSEDEVKASHKKPKAEDTSLIATRFITIYAGLLATSVIAGWYTNFGFDANAFAGPDAAKNQLNRMIVLEVVDIVLIVASLFWIPKPSASARVSWPRYLASWAAAPVMLGIALAVNLGYHRLLLNLLGVAEVEDTFYAECGLSLPLLFAICIQPAIFEELFFRHLTLGSLRGATGVHGAVIASSIMFGVCHLGAPLSMPVLTFIGLIFGYARVFSGGLALPIALHFCHNLAIVLLSMQ